MQSPILGSNSDIFEFENIWVKYKLRPFLKWVEVLDFIKIRASIADVFSNEYWFLKTLIFNVFSILSYSYTSKVKSDYGIFVETKNKKKTPFMLWMETSLLLVNQV